MSDLSESLALNLSNVQHLDQVRDVSAGPLVMRRSTSLDDLLITNPKSTVIFPVRDPAAKQYGLKKGDLLVVDRLAKPRQDQLIIVLINDELLVRRMGAGQPASHREHNLGAATEGHGAVWGVVTYAIQKQI